LKRRIHIDLIVDNNTTANSLLSEARTKIDQYDIFSKDVDIQKVVMGGVIHLVGQIRLNIDAESTTIKNWIVDKWNNSVVKNNILAGSKITIHSCTHEQETWYPCVEDVIVIK